VILVSVDGLRPDAIEAFGASTIQRLMREGAFTLSARTVVPSKTLPAHTSMLTGEFPDAHGVTWNTVATSRARTIETPTVFAMARTRGYRTAAFFSKPKFQPLQRRDALDYSQAPGGWWGGWPASRTMSDVERYLDTTRPNLLFVHFADPDRAGHDRGWMSAAYGRAVNDTDAAIGRLLAAADRAYGCGQYALIVTADHGGDGRDHGTDDPLDVTIPWVAWGQGIPPIGQLDGRDVIITDTAPTVLSLLGITPPSDWGGRTVLTQ
jgi:predicted AlkP superfamily pyrophosphatase or phosphodiesterase